MAVTRTSIVNRAILWIGEGKVTDVDEKAASLAADAVLDETLEVLLEEHPWNFAFGQRTLAPSTDTDATWAYVFMLPADCLVVREVVGDLYHRVENGRLMVDADAVTIRYTRRVEQFSAMPASFRAALAARVAQAIGLQFGKKPDDFLRTCDGLLRTAKSIDAQGGGREEALRPHHLLDSRRW